MASVVGGSGAFRLVLEELRRAGLDDEPESMVELEALVRRMRSELEARRVELRAEIDVEARELSERVRDLTATLDEQVEEMRREAEEPIRLIDERLAQGIGCNFLMWPFEFLDRTILRARRRKLVGGPDRFAEQRRREIDEGWRHFQRLRLSPDDVVAERTRAESGRLEALRKVLNGPEARGARAESAVAERLAALPDTYRVLNDVNIELDRGVRFDGNWRRSAQIDHVVVGPAGAFVVETKCWSRDFLDGNDGLGPHEQAGSASLLCYVALQEAGYSCKVRSIIACAGVQIPDDEESKTKVLRLDGLTGYIRWFEEREPRIDVDGVSRWLERCVATN